MKVLFINGSPKPNACIGTGFKIMEEIFNEAGVETEIVHVGNKPIRGCVACLSCKKTGKCVFNDLVNETHPKLAEADGIVVGTPVYFGNPNGTVLSFMQRLLYSFPGSLHLKVGASVISNRRGGNSATFEAMNQFFGITSIATAPSTYWNDIHGYTAEDVYKDEEGVQTLQNLARNMIFMMKAFQEQKQKEGLPVFEKTAHTNMIR